MSLLKTDVYILVVKVIFVLRGHCTNNSDLLPSEVP